MPQKAGKKPLAARIWGVATSWDLEDLSIPVDGGSLLRCGMHWFFQVNPDPQARAQTKQWLHANPGVSRSSIGLKAIAPLCLSRRTVEPDVSTESAKCGHIYSYIYIIRI